VPDGERPKENTGTTLLTVVVVVAVLYFAREVFIPLALAVLLAFLLAPLSHRLRRWGLWRVPSVLVVVLFSFALIGVIGAVMASQLTDLGHKLPEYQHNVHQKVESIRNSGSGLMTRATRLVQRISEELTPRPSPVAGNSRSEARNPNQDQIDGSESKTTTQEDKPVPVEIRRSNFSPVEIVQKVLGSVITVVMTAVIVIVFVIFMLFQEEDLRDRLIRLAGAGRVSMTTKVLDDAAGRVSRYLLAQLIINTGFGVLAGIALAIMGVPNPLLWGMIAALFRYVPYLGIWIAAIMPAAVAFAVEPGWVKAPLIFGIYFGIDLLMYNFAEPFLYGSSTGVSPLAILVAAVFWTWLWGAVGLLLATPLTVLVVVIGRHVPSLEFLAVMLSDEPVLKPETRFYQRLLAMDLEEATEIAEEFIKGKSLEELYDSLIIPALTLAEEDRHRGKMDENRQRFVFRNARILVEDLAERAEELMAGNRKERSEGRGPKADAVEEAKHKSTEAQGLKEGVAARKAEVFCLPARDEADAIAALMLAQLLNKRGVGARALPASVPGLEPFEEVSREKPRVACVFAVPPFGYAHARYLCRQLQTQFQQLKLVAAILTERDVQEVKERRPSIPAHRLVSSLRQAVGEVVADFASA
jgi:predicted PurR-regulated permease PerM